MECLLETNIFLNIPVATLTSFEQQIQQMLQLIQRN